MKRRPDSLAEHALVIGFARTGQSVAKVLRRGGVAVSAYDDRPSEAARAAAASLDIELAGPGPDVLAGLVGQADLIVLSPGVPPSHPVFDLAPEDSVISEIELAYQLMDAPVVAVTGTNGKTTVVSLVAEMLQRSGYRASALGNIGTPLIEAALDESLEMAVAEVSSFQLQRTRTFEPIVGTWLNLAEDHLDWHRDLSEYAAAKAKIWAAQGATDVAIANAEDPIVMAAASRVTSRVVTFGEHAGDYHLEDDALVGPEGELARVSDLVRSLPHDKVNALAAIATARQAGASPDACREALRSQEIPAHRVEFVAEIGGVRFYDDSKATTPSAVMAALAGFEHVVLIAGGRNKGLDLGAIRRYLDTEQAGRVHGVVAIGESADELIDAFTPGYVVEKAASMPDAVTTAARLAKVGDAVLLSPGCASFDWYRSYEERGEDFKAAVAKQVRA